ncbi:cation:proton antiporter [Ilyobacter polytropus]|uniref:Sodium/proton antiporter, CPA1 family n=1 Tax=Ilyobacter polytropus (strain ATCC 51220 / DSM 2926 / LMG 16218 / CuHBu1) TaxID=572544 RepID=E3HDU4_ILYPC|nr:cation:proton antiporter [Ilyobacter polytropus]ADO84280.1 sodium/proton antiporter, CPA1 family [Ilyobacter polytropus DSM 2926]
MKTLLSLAILLIGGHYAGKIAEKMKLPKLMGMIIFGCIVGPAYLNQIDSLTLHMSKELKSIALVTVLITGGLGISTEQLKKMGRPALLLSFIPAGLEGFAVAFAAMKLFGFTFIQGGILGFIISAVSPAVLIPSMVDLISRGIGQRKAIPQMMLAGGSADDSIAIALFTTFMSLYLGSSSGIASNLLLVPVSIVLGVFSGIAAALLLKFLCKITKNPITHCFLVLATGVGMRVLEELKILKINSLIGVMVMGFVISNYCEEELGTSLKQTLGKVWQVGQIYLFTLVGTAINPTLIGNLLIPGTLAIMSALVIRSIGTWISLIGTDLTYKERLFCVIAYLPKATVQSAKAGVPLQMGVVGGELIQAVSILSVLITAPIGAIGIKLTAIPLLEPESQLKVSQEYLK